MGWIEVEQRVLPGYERFFFNNSTVPQIPENLVDLENGPTDQELRDLIMLRDFILMVKSPMVLGFLLYEIAAQIDLSPQEIREKLSRI